MTTFSTSQIRRDPTVLTEPGQHLLTRRGKEVAQLNVTMEFAHDPVAARAAFARYMKATENVKPNPRGGAVAAVRRLRDGGMRQAAIAAGVPLWSG